MNKLDNVLLTAMMVIPPEPIKYEKWVSNTTNSIGYDVSTYATAVDTIASIQGHISEKMYQAYGLDLNRNYCLVDIPAELVGVAEKTTPDRLTFHGRKWIVVKCNNWHTYNGWCKLIVVEEKDYNGSQN